MWKSFIAWMATAKAGAITNGSAAIVWGSLAATSASEPLRWIVGFNALLFAFLAGNKLADHFNQRIAQMREAWVDLQHRQIMNLMVENAKLRDASYGLETSPELEDDTRLS